MTLESDQIASAHAEGILGRPKLARFVVHRDAFMRELDAALEAQLVFLRGPIGLGKTTALAEWAERAELHGTRGVWISEAMAATAERFWSVLWTSLREAGLTRTAFAGDSWYLHAAEHLVSEPFILIVDDFSAELLGEVSVGVLEIVRQRPAVSVIVSSRARSPMERIDVLASVDCDIVRAGSLLLAADEVSDALRLRGLAFEPGVVDMVQRLSGGYPAAVGRICAHMLAEDHRGVWRVADVAPLCDIVEAELEDVLVSSMRLQLSTSWEAVQQLSLLPYITVFQAEEVLAGTADAKEVLRLLEDNGLGLWTLAGGEDHFQLLSFVRGLINRSIDGLDHVDADRLRSHAARRAESMGSPQHALEQALAARDWHRISDITYRNYAVLARENLPELNRILGAIPKDFVADDPWLQCFATAVSFALQGESIRPSGPQFAKADKAARERLREHRSTKWSAVRIYSARRAGSFNTSLGEAEQFLTGMSAPRGPEQSRDEAEAGAQIGVTFLHLGLYSRASRIFSTTFSSPAAGEYLRVQSAGYLAVISALRGEMEEAERWIAAASSSRGWHEWKHTVWGLPTHAAAALCAAEHNQASRATTALQTVARISAMTEDWPLIAFIVGYANLALGNGYAGFAAIRDIEGMYSTDTVSNHFLGMLAVIKSDLLLTAKQARPALSSLVPYLDGRETLAGAHSRALLFNGANDKAAVYANRWARSTGSSPRTTVETGVVAAIASARLGDDAEAVNSLRHAFSVAQGYGLKLALSMVPRSELLALAERAHLDIASHIADTSRAFDAELTVPTLTRRESIVLSQLRKPASLEAIAGELRVSPNTVKSQVRSIYRKLGVTRRSDALRVALDWRLITPLGDVSSRQ